MRKLVAGNWKMNGTADDLAEVQKIAALQRRCDVALCLPATLIERAARSVSEVPIGGQDVHSATHGAHTGCISASMLLDAGAQLTIVGHSERREAQGESDADVRAKAETALAAGLEVILCCGESDAVRAAGEAVDIVRAQLKASLPKCEGARERLSVAYEPIWAIGTGKIPTLADIGEMHGALRDCLVEAFGEAGRSVRLLYGGSVKGSNAAEIFEVRDVDGALVGGASLTADDFAPIVEAAG